MATPLPKHRAREYETIFILNPEITTDGIEQIAARLTDVIDRLDGKLLQAENWGKRRLAYPVRKHPKGYYVYLRYLGYSDLVQELERNMRMLEPVLKYLTVKLDEDVDPAARPVQEEEISFLPQVEEVPERPRSRKPLSSADADGEPETAEETPAPEAETAAVEKAPAPEAETAAVEKTPAPVAETAAAEEAPAPVAEPAAAEEAPAPVAETAAAEEAPAPVAEPAAVEEAEAETDSAKKAEE